MAADAAGGLGANPSARHLAHPDLADGQGCMDMRPSTRPEKRCLGCRIIVRAPGVHLGTKQQFGGSGSRQIGKSAVFVRPGGAQRRRPIT
jgi:hypothetical protein